MDVLGKARGAVHGERDELYGHPRDNLARIARIWSVILGVDVSPEEVAACMVGLKLARLAQTPNHADTWIDIAGYAETWGLLQEPREE